MKISVLIPVFNTPPHHLIEAFISMHNQTLKPDEIILINDGSTNQNTIYTLKLLRELFNANIINLEVNSGTSVALNKGHEVARNEWIAVMGSDDISFANRLASQVNFLNEHPATDVLGTGLFAFYDSDPYRHSVFKKHHRDIVTEIGNGWVCNHGTAMYRKSMFKKLGYSGYNPAFKRGQDVDLWKRVFAAGLTIRNIPEILYAYRRYAK